MAVSVRGGSTPGGINGKGGGMGQANIGETKGTSKTKKAMPKKGRAWFERKVAELKTELEKLSDGPARATESGTRRPKGTGNNDEARRVLPGVAAHGYPDGTMAPDDGAGKIHLTLNGSINGWCDYEGGVGAGTGLVPRANLAIVRDGASREAGRQS